MPTLRILVFLSFLAACCAARSQGVKYIWSQTWHADPYDATPSGRMAINEVSSSNWLAFVGAYSHPSPNTLANLLAFGKANQDVAPLSDHFLPVDVSLPQGFGVANQSPLVLGKKILGTGSKVAVYSSNGSALVYLFNPSGTSFDEPLALDASPFAGYSVANIQVAGGRELAVFAPPPVGTDPTIKSEDPRIAPTSAFFLGSNLYAVGTDNSTALTNGGARAVAYSVDSGGAVTPVFTKTAANTVVGSVQTSYKYVWGALDSAHTYLVTVQTAHNTSTNTTKWTYSIQQLDALGNVHWTSAVTTGFVTTISVGSANDIYVAGIDGVNGHPFVTSYNSSGSARWLRPVPFVSIANALTGGVVVGDNEIDASGHHHVHLTKYSQTGAVVWALTQSTFATSDDFLTDLRWASGHIFFEGQSVPVTGNKFVFAAEYDQVPEPPTLTVTNLPSTYLKNTPTYDGSGQVTEPSVLYIPGGWNGYTYWITAAPYPGANTKLENASIWATNDAPGPAQRWFVPPGVTNPVVPPPTGNFINADQSIFLDDDGTMYLYYSTTDTVTKYIYVISSKDGWKTITPKILLFTTAWHTSNPLISTVLKDPASGKYFLWQADGAVAPRIFVRWTSDSPNGPFTDKQVCKINNLPTNRSPWEQNIIHAPQGTDLYCLITLGTPGASGPGRGGTNLYFMSSGDNGLTWTCVPKPIIATGASGTWDDLEIYRASLQPTLATLHGISNTYNVWYSATNTALVWHAAYAGAIITH